MFLPDCCVLVNLYTSRGCNLADVKRAYAIIKIVIMRKFSMHQIWIVNSKHGGIQVSWAAIANVTYNEAALFGARRKKKKPVRTVDILILKKS